jgi:triphosphoribosyl-dephospho-CoA synthase
MSDPLDPIRRQVRDPADAIRWACVLEATAPKAGNVHPGRSFDDLCYRDFIDAADITADSLSDPAVPIGARMFRAVERTRRSLGTNVNLGIVLLLGPLVAADTSRHRTREHWGAAIARQLEGLGEDDGGRILDAIRVASPGGLGVVADMDVHQMAGTPIDLLGAMEIAQTRDRVALQYATRFDDLIRRIAPVVAEAVVDRGAILEGIATAHLRLLADAPDTLIARKAGQAVAEEVQRRARRVDPNDDDAVAAFDQYLRRDGNRLNPGTTADLIAAALYLLLRTDS